MSSAAAQAFGVSFQISPIILVGGIATLAGGILPIVALTQALSFTVGILDGANESDVNQYLAQFAPIPGATIISQTIGEYPFANQATAANAVITTPLTLSMRMDISAKPGVGYITKLATMMALKATIEQHNNMGGLYTVITPSGVWDNCICQDIRDISRSDIKQPQNAWQWDFRKPLVTLAQAAAAQNSLMSKISNGAPTDGSLSGINTTIAQPPSIAGPLIAPSMANAAGATITPINPNLPTPSF